MTKILENSTRGKSQQRPSAIKTRRRGSQEGGKGEVNLPPGGRRFGKTGIGLLENKKKEERRKDLHARPEGRRILSGPGRPVPQNSNSKFGRYRAQILNLNFEETVPSGD